MADFRMACNFCSSWRSAISAAFAIGNVAHNRGSSDNAAILVAQRGDGDGDDDDAAVARGAYRFIVVNGFTATYSIEDLFFLLEVVGGNNQGDGLADSLSCAVTEKFLSGGIPVQDAAIERFGDDRVVRGSDDGGEAALLIEGVGLAD